MNLVEYVKLLKQEQYKAEQFLIAAKSISAGDSDLPENALKMIASDGDIAQQFIDSFDTLEAAIGQIHVQIIEARSKAQS